MNSLLTRRTRNQISVWRRSLTAPSGPALFGAGLPHTTAASRRTRLLTAPSGPTDSLFGAVARGVAGAPPSRRGACRNRGSALIVVVLFLTLITLLAMAAAVMLRLEQNESKANTHAVYARELADGAADYAISLLRQAMPAPSTTQAWVVAPGRAWYSSNGQWTNLALYTQSTPIPGRTTGTNAAFYPNTTVLLNTGGINLNEGLFVTGNNSIYYNWIVTNGWTGVGLNTNTGVFTTNWNYQSLGVPLLAGWVTLGANGQPGGYYGPSNLLWYGQGEYDAAFNTNVNPVVARIAVWIDADACKVNLNTAGYRDAASTNRSNPRDIDLRALEAPFANAGTANINTLTAQTLTTPEELRRYTSTWSGSDTNDFIRNKFGLTLAAGDANVDAFGRPRVNLNGLTMADTNNSVFSDTLWATMLYSNVVTDPNRNTFLKKYGRFGIAQMMANLVDYRNAASTAPTMSSRDADYIPQYYCGLKKGPMINAVIVHVATNAVNTTNLEVRVWIDVKLVNGYDTPAGNDWQVAVKTDSIKYLSTGPSLNTNVEITVSGEAFYRLTSDMPANSYRRLSDASGFDVPISGHLQTLPNDGTSTNSPPVLTQVKVRLRKVRLFNGSGDERILDWLAPVDITNAVGGEFVFGTGGYPHSGIIPYPPDFNSLGTNTNFRPIALVKQDPRVRTFTGWSGAAGDFANNATNSLSANWISYPRFVDSDWKLVVASNNEFSFDSTASLTIYGLLADLRGGTTATQKRVYADIAEANFQSVGELGHIHTGYPWRTIRLRSVVPETTGTTTNSATADARLNVPYRDTGDPNTANPGVETNALPDWVMLDMFTATNATSVAGKININGAIHGETVYLPQYYTSLSDSKGWGNFVNTTNTMAARLPPIRALLVNTSSDLTHSNAALDIIARNIINRTFVTNSPYASTTGNRPPAYLTPGEICEVAGLGYFNDVTWHPSSADREQAIRRIGELVTTRSDTFTIWAVAQVIKERKWFRAGKWSQLPYTEPDGLVDWVWFHPKWLFADGDGDEDTLGDKGLTPDFILAEVRMQTVVQRYVDGTGKVCFRTLYTRYWSE